MNNRHVLIQGDTTEEATLPGDCVDLIITSPPYNLSIDYASGADDSRSYDDYLDFSRRWLENCLYWARATGRLCVNVGLDINAPTGKHPVTADITRIAMEVGWKYHTTILWLKGRTGRGYIWGSWRSASAPSLIVAAESVLVFYKDRWKLERPDGNERASDTEAREFMSWVPAVWKFPGEGQREGGHPAPFPPELPKRCIKLLSFIGDTVLDPFAGSGTTMMVAAQLGRVAIGVELGDGYCEGIRGRLTRECALSWLQPGPGRWEAERRATQRMLF